MASSVAIAQARPVNPAWSFVKLIPGVLLLAGTDGFFELKRSRTREPIFA